MARSYGTMTDAVARPCGLLRRLLAILYDSLLLFSLLFFATLILLPVTGGKAFPGNSHLYHIYLSICSYLYFAWQWAHGGQTLGMKAWRIRLMTMDNRVIGWRQASLRVLLAVISCLTFGAGFLWIFFDRDALAFHDRFSGTKLIRIN